jgi:UPF0755 protein
MSGHRKGRRIFSSIILFLLITGLVLIAGYFFIVHRVQVEFGSPAGGLSSLQRIIIPIELFVNRRALTEPQSTLREEYKFSIEEGESVAMICIRLERERLIPNAEVMRMYLIYTGLDRALKSGEFSLSTQMSPVQIADALLKTVPKDAVISILPGWRIEEVAANVAASGLMISADAFIESAYNPSQNKIAVLPSSEINSLEGFLYPGIYVMPRDSDIDALLEMVLSAFNEQLNPVLVEGFNRQGLSLMEAVKLASIVQREAVVSDEKPLIASVFYNRLAIGMRLETDPTVQYALGFDGATNSWWKSPLSLNDFKIDSPYNTYLYNGLPPTPICNPDLESLKAVAFPADTPYYYFRAACDGSGRHNFAVSYEEHLNNSCE